MKALIFVFGLYAVFCAFGAITGIQAYHSGEIVRYHDWQRILPAIFAPISAALCYGSSSVGFGRGAPAFASDT
jgi:hypothetical protein